MRTLLPALLVLSIVSICSCSSRDADWKETYPVTGEVYVDGEPAAGLAVKLHDVKGFDTEQPTVTSSMTDARGRFLASTYEEADGAPAGEYIVTFSWGKLNTLTMSYEGDKLNGKYADPEKSEFKVTVVEGQPADIGRIELTTE